MRLLRNRGGALARSVGCDRLAVATILPHAAMFTAAQARGSYFDLLLDRKSPYLYRDTCIKFNPPACSTLNNSTTSYRAFLYILCQPYYIYIIRFALCETFDFSDRTYAGDGPAAREVYRGPFWVPGKLSNYDRVWAIYPNFCKPRLLLFLSPM